MQNDKSDPPPPIPETEWYTASGRMKLHRWNPNLGRYEPDPDDHD